MPTFILSLPNSLLRTDYLWGRLWENMVLPSSKTFSRCKNVHLLLLWCLRYCDVINPEIENRCGDTPVWKAQMTHRNYL